MPTCLPLPFWLSFTETKSDNVEGGRGSPKDGPQSVSKIEHRLPQSEPYKIPQARGKEGDSRKPAKEAESKMKQWALGKCPCGTELNSQDDLSV